MSESNRLDLVTMLFKKLKQEFPVAYEDQLLRRAEVMVDNQLRFA